MAKTIEQISGMTIGHVKLGFRGGVTGSVRQQVHDGDTINVTAAGNFGVRFLGVDAPEISFTLPGEKTFTVMSNAKWESFLHNPFAGVNLAAGLVKHLKRRIRKGVAGNHHDLAVAAEDALEQEVRKDMAALGQTEEEFKFFLVFAYEVMDRFGRFLCYINRDQPDDKTPGPRPKSYNERLLKAGRVSAYFIWPNINPFRKQKSLREAVFAPGTASKIANSEPTLRAARDSVRNARRQKIGIFDAANPLRLEPFEVRYLARQRPPDRWVLDLSKSDNTLIHPQNYFTVPNPEDRLFISEEFVPLFVEAGWRRQAAP